MNTSFFGEMLNSITERGRALLDRTRDRRGRSRRRARRAWPSCARNCCPAAARRPAWRSPAKFSPNMPSSRPARASPSSRRWRTGSAPTATQLDAAITAWQAAPSDKTAAEVHAAAEPRRQELLRRLNLAPGGTAALVRMREQLLDALDHREDLAAVDADFVHLFSSWFNRGFLVLRRIDWSTPAMILEKIIRYEAVHEIRELGRPAPPHRSARPALLRVLPSGAGRRAADLRRGRADARHPRRDRADPGGPARRRRAGQGHDRGVLFDLQLPARACRRVVRQLPDQAGGRGDFAREPAAVDLRHAVAGAGLRALARPRAQDRNRRRCRPRTARRSRASTAPGWWQRAAGARADAGAAAARGRLVLSQRAQNRRGLPVDPVARFHLGNGARLERLNWLADGTEKGLDQSTG